MNPFKILDIRPGASGKEIIRAVALAMREKRHPGKELAQAQKMLLDPASGAAREFMHCIDLAPLKAPLNIKKPEGLEREDIPELSRLTIFDEDA